MALMFINQLIAFIDSMTSDLTAGKVFIECTPYALSAGTRYSLTVHSILQQGRYSLNVPSILPAGKAFM